MADLQVLLDAVASPIRREILWLTWDAELTVGEIGAAFEISGPTLSSHLATLRDAELVTMRVDGNFRRYRCDQDAVRALVDFAFGPLRCAHLELIDRWYTGALSPTQLDEISSALRTVRAVVRPGAEAGA